MGLIKKSLCCNACVNYSNVSGKFVCLNCNKINSKVLLISRGEKYKHIRRILVVKECLI